MLREINIHQESKEEATLSEDENLKDIDQLKDIKNNTNTLKYKKKIDLNMIELSDYQRKWMMKLWMFFVLYIRSGDMLFWVASK